MHTTGRQQTNATEGAQPPDRLLRKSEAFGPSGLIPVAMSTAYDWINRGLLAPPSNSGPVSARGATATSRTSSAAPKKPPVPGNLSLLSLITREASDASQTF